MYNIKSRVRNLSHKNKIVKKAYLLANKIKVKSLQILSDEKFAKMKYKENTGKMLDLENPSTFNDKLWWLKLNNRDPLLTRCSDKVEVREYVKECGLQDILNEVYGVYDNPEDINFKNLPNKAFIKTNHGSGTNRLWDKNKMFDKEEFIKKFNYALKQNYYLYSREWNYKNINPKIIVEKVLEDEYNPSLIDYRFFCFNGKVKMIIVDIDTTAPDGSHSTYASRNVYNEDFSYVDVKTDRQSFDRSLVKKPHNFKKMIKYSEILSKPFPHCRVDLYNIDGKIYFGEITFYHGGASQNIYPEKWAKKMGDWIDLDSEKIILN